MPINGKNRPINRNTYPMPTNSREILDQIAELQSALEGFSFDQLTVAEAQALKTSFNAFRSGLESRIWGPSGAAPARPGSPAGPDREEFRAREEDLNRIMATLGHELRNPLHAIQGLTLILQEEPLSERQTEHLLAIHTASENLLQLVGELLEYSRMHTDHEPVARIAFSPKQLIRQVGYLCDTLIVSPGVSLELSLDPGTPDRLMGDPAKLSQILMNLLGNAIKFTDEGTIELKVWPEYKPDSCLLHGEVRDTGPGISPEDLPHIFDAFRRGRDGSGVNPLGMGLGLSIVKKTLDRLGGTIAAESKPGKGTAFRFQIPFGLDAGTEAPVARPRETAQPLSGKTILVIEDNLLNQKLIETRLKGWGCRVLTSEKALYGISLLSEVPVDLVVMDLRMPGMDGFQASVRIRNHADPAISHIPIVAVTADLTAEDSEQVRRAGIDDVVLKPYSADELLDKLLVQLKNPRGASSKTVVQEKDCSGAVSLEGIWGECLGDFEMLEEMVKLFRSNLLEFLGALKTHLTLLDYEQIASCIHKIKAGLKLVEAASWLEKLEELQALNRSMSGVGRMRQLYREMLEDYPQLDQDLDRALEQIKNDYYHD